MTNLRFETHTFTVSNGPSMMRHMARNLSGNSEVLKSKQGRRAKMWNMPTGPHLLGGLSVSKWLTTMVIVSPLSKVVGSLPNGLNGFYMGVILTTYKSWDDPPSVNVTPANPKKNHPWTRWRIRDVSDTRGVLNQRVYSDLTWVPGPLKR